MKKKFRLEFVDYMMLLILIAVIGLLMFSQTGCATPPTLTYDSQGNLTGGTTSWGFLRTIKICQKKADGSEITIETSSNTGDVLNGMNQILGTIVNAASKVNP